MKYRNNNMPLKHGGKFGFAQKIKGEIIRGDNDQFIKFNGEAVVKPELTNKIKAICDVFDIDRKVEGRNCLGEVLTIKKIKLSQDDTNKYIGIEKRKYDPKDEYELVIDRKNINGNIHFNDCYAKQDQRVQTDSSHLPYLHENTKKVITSAKDRCNVQFGEFNFDPAQITINYGYLNKRKD